MCPSSLPCSHPYGVALASVSLPVLCLSVSIPSLSVSPLCLSVYLSCSGCLLLTFTALCLSLSFCLSLCFCPSLINKLLLIFLSTCLYVYLSGCNYLSFL